MNLKDEIDKVWCDLYGPDAPPSADDNAARNRILMIASAVKCAEDNFRVTNKAYCELDRKMRDPARHYLIISDIIADIRGRSGIGNALEEIDRDTLNEMIETWRGFFTK